MSLTSPPSQDGSAAALPASMVMTGNRVRSDTIRGRREGWGSTWRQTSTVQVSGWLDERPDAAQVPSCRACSSRRNCRAIRSATANAATGAQSWKEGQARASRFICMGPKEAGPMSKMQMAKRKFEHLVSAAGWTCLDLPQQRNP